MKDKASYQLFLYNTDLFSQRLMGMTPHNKVGEKK